MKSILLDKKLLGLVEMTSGLVNASFSLPEWQALKMIFFAPCLKERVGFLLSFPGRGWVGLNTGFMIHHCIIKPVSEHIVFIFCGCALMP